MPGGGRGRATARRLGPCVVLALAGCNLALPLDPPAVDGGVSDSPATRDVVSLDTTEDVIADGKGPPEDGWPEPDWPALPPDMGVKLDKAVKNDLAPKLDGAAPTDSYVPPKDTYVPPDTTHDSYVPPDAYVPPDTTHDSYVPPDAYVPPDTTHDSYVEQDIAPPPDSNTQPDTTQPQDSGTISCADLEGDYLVALGQAKKCSPMIPVQQCTQLENDKLACPCKTFVNPNNTAALSTMSSLRSQWLAQSCDKGIYCPMGCAIPISGQCSGNGGCIDLFF